MYACRHTYSSVRACRHTHTHSKTHAWMPAVDGIVLSSGALIRPLVVKRHTDRGSSFHRAHFSAEPSTDRKAFVCHQPCSSTAQIAPHGWPLSFSAPLLHQCCTLSGTSFGAVIQRKCHRCAVEKVTFKNTRYSPRGDQLSILHNIMSLGRTLWRLSLIKVWTFKTFETIKNTIAR